MNIKKILATTIVLSAIPLTGLAQDYGYNGDGQNERGYNEDSSSSNQNSDAYESSFGNRYKYNLGDPGDRVKYGVDAAAQLRDSIDVNPIRSIERNIGEYGGGVLDD